MVKVLNSIVVSENCIERLCVDNTFEVYISLEVLKYDSLVRDVFSRSGHILVEIQP